MNVVKKKFALNFKEMFFSFLLWFVGLCLNVLPILYKVINTWLSTQTSNLGIDYSAMFWGDLDFLAINFSVSFLLLLELCFVQTKIQFIDKSLKAILFLLTFVLIVTYTIASFSEGWSTHVPVSLVQNINIWTLIFIIFLGIIYFFISSLKITKEVV